MKWILLPVRYHSVHLSTHRRCSFNVYKCPSAYDEKNRGRGKERACQAQVKWMENTERIKNECSMMRHKNKKKV